MFPQLPLGDPVLDLLPFPDQARMCRTSRSAPLASPSLTRLLQEEFHELGTIRILRFHVFRGEDGEQEGREEHGGGGGGLVQQRRPHFE